MSQQSENPPGAPSTDVVICGGGLAGLLLARQIRRELPDLDVTVLERTRRPLPEACHKVGESSVELGTLYLERLGLREYLESQHILKLGLRFFPGGGHLPLHERTEVGPCAEPIVRSYQLDRGRFENDVRGFVEEDGVRLVEGARVSGVELSTDGDHTVAFVLDGEERKLSARWVVDATGRAALLRRKLRQTRGLRHKANAGWFRVAGRVDINDMVPREETEWHARPVASDRWRSTNHFMGTGYWAWVIPLSSGNTSIGLVVHDDVHGHKCISSLEQVMGFLREHEPHLARHLEGYQPTDFLALRDYSNSVGRAWSHERWAMVGEAGAFVDPLYSPGTDMIAFANCFTVEVLRADYGGGDLELRAREVNARYRATVVGIVDLFRLAAPIYGHPTAMATKIFWDNFSYWSFTCQMYAQELYRLGLEEYQPFRDVGERLLWLGSKMQLLLAAWAELAPEPQRAEFIGAPHFPSVLIDAHVRVGERMSHEELLDYLRIRVPQIEEVAGEIALRVVQQVGPELGRKILERAGFAKWGIRVPLRRLETEGLVGHARRTRLSTIARDLERTLGKIERHPQAELARELFAEGVPS